VAVDVVSADGPRFTGGRPHRTLYIRDCAGNRILAPSRTSNMLTRLNLSEMETCDERFRRRVPEGIRALWCTLEHGLRRRLAGPRGGRRDVP